MSLRHQDYDESDFVYADKIANEKCMENPLAKKLLAALKAAEPHIRMYPSASKVRKLVREAIAEAEAKQ